MNIQSASANVKGCLIDNQWVPTSDRVPVFDPANGEAFTDIPAGGPDEINAAVEAARRAFDGGAWSKLTATDRGRLLTKLGEKISENAEELAHLESRDTGKPMRQARADMVAAARYFEYYGGAADKVHGQTIPFMEGYNVQAWYEPHGVTGHIIPWNYPAQMFGRTLAPALAMGNATVLKPAEEACLTPMRIAALAVEVGMPTGAINVVPGLGQSAGAALSQATGIDFISFTGSPEVGVMIQQEAAKLHIGCTLELGGKSPQIVFADADFDKAIPVLCNAIVQNGGQTCSAGSRVLVETAAHEQLVTRLAETFSKLVAAPGMQDGDLGPLISAKQKARVDRFIETARPPLLARGSVADGAPEGGYYVAPALFGPAAEDDPLAQDEVFGPVLTVIPFDDEADAIRMANATEYGLVAGIWTENAGRQMRVAKGMRCGQVFLNGYGAGGGIELPFGGIRKSGHGREKGFAALHEFAQLKTVVHNHG
jgi:aldehyde dehydrogenase (NAD+)